MSSFKEGKAEELAEESGEKSFSVLVLVFPSTIHSQFHFLAQSNQFSVTSAPVSTLPVTSKRGLEGDAHTLVFCSLWRHRL